jgi:nicotinamidase-related amidase
MRADEGNSTAMHDQPIIADESAIVFTDLQEGIINVGATNDSVRLRVHVAALADLAKAFAIPLVVSCVPTTGGIVAPILREIAERYPDLQPLVRTSADAMDDNAFRAALDASGRKTVILAGVATEVAVRLCAMSLRRYGYHPVVALDACSGFDARTESATLLHLCAAGVELSAVATIAAQLAGDFNTERGRAAMRALQSTLSLHQHHDSDADTSADR